MSMSGNDDIIQICSIIFQRPIARWDKVNSTQTGLILPLRHRNREAKGTPSTIPLPTKYLYHIHNKHYQNPTNINSIRKCKNPLTHQE